MPTVDMRRLHHYPHTGMLCPKFQSISLSLLALLIGNSTSNRLIGPRIPPGFNLPETLLFVVHHGRSWPLPVAQVADMMRQFGHGLHLGSAGLGSLVTTSLQYVSNWRAIWFGTTRCVRGIISHCKTSRILPRAIESAFTLSTYITRTGWLIPSSTSINPKHKYSCSRTISMCMLCWISMF